MDNYLKYFIIMSFFIHIGILGTFVIPEFRVNNTGVEQKALVKENIAKINKKTILNLNLENLKLQKDEQKGSKVLGRKVRDNTINLNSQNPKYIRYLEKVRYKIESVWKYPFEAKKNEIHGKLTLKFAVDKNGKLKKVSLIKPCYYNILNQESIRAVKVAAPFPAIPSKIGLNILNIIANFEYIAN